MKETTNHKYRVIVADNFHYMDESEHYTLGEFDTLETAIAACRKIVDDLGHLSLSKPGMTAQELYELYNLFGEDPFVRVPPGEPASTFSAWGYAKQRASEMCGVPPTPAPDAPPSAAPPTLTRNEPPPMPGPSSSSPAVQDRSPTHSMYDLKTLRWNIANPSTSLSSTTTKAVRAAATVAIEPMKRINAR